MKFVRRSGLLLLLWLGLTPGAAHGQAEKPPPAAAEHEESNLSTDPTEPSTLPALVELKGKQSDHLDDEAKQESVPGDPWGDVSGDSLPSLRALLQVRYRTTFARDSASPRG
jgi:hypothetical protein